MNIYENLYLSHLVERWIGSKDTVSSASGRCRILFTMLSSDWTYFLAIILFSLSVFLLHTCPTSVTSKVSLPNLNLKSHWL